MRSLVQHLLFRYSAPGFLYACFAGSDAEHLPRQSPEGLGRSLAVHVGQGGSPAKFGKVHVWEPNLTRRMGAELMKTTKVFALPQSVRRAHFRILIPGASRTRKASLASLSRYATDDAFRKQFVFETMQWFANQALLDPAQVGPLVDFIAFERERDPAYRIIGRSGAHLLEQMERWRLGLAKATDAKTVFESASFRSLFGTNKERKVETESATLEPLSSTALVSEGRAMRHCVASCAGRLRSGAVSIWSLNCNSQFDSQHRRLVTIEVDNRNEVLRQARCPSNRQPTASQGDMSTRRAACAGLRISVGVFV